MTSVFQSSSSTDWASVVRSSIFIQLPFRRASTPAFPLAPQSRPPLSPWTESVVNWFHRSRPPWASIVNFARGGAETSIAFGVLFITGTSHLYPSCKRCHRGSPASVSRPYWARGSSLMIEGIVFQNPHLRLLRLITLLGNSFACYHAGAASGRSFSGSLTPLICLAECRTATSHAAKRASQCGLSMYILVLV